MTDFNVVIDQILSSDVKIGHLSDVVKICNGKDYKSLHEGSIPVLGSGGIMTYVDESLYDGPSVLIPRKGSLENVFYMDSPFWTVDTLYYTVIDESVVIPKYLYYYLEASHLEKLNEAGGVPSLTQSTIYGFEIYLPSLDIQRLIVSVLDSFVGLGNSIESELASRKIQFAESRDILLDNCCCNVPTVDVGSIAEVGTGSSNRVDAKVDGKYPFFVRSDKVEKMDKFEYDEEAIIIPGEGGIGDIFHYVNGKYALHQRVYRIHLLSEEFDTRFVYYYFMNSFKKYIMMEAVSATVTSIRKPMIESFQIPVVPLSVQKDIVLKLDLFSNLIDSLSGECDSRNQQFEYYRDLILSFRGTDA